MPGNCVGIALVAMPSASGDPTAWITSGQPLANSMPYGNVGRYCGASMSSLTRGDGFVFAVVPGTFVARATPASACVVADDSLRAGALVLSAWMVDAAATANVRMLNMGRFMARPRMLIFSTPMSPADTGQPSRERGFSVLRLQRAPACQPGSHVLRFRH